MNPTQSQASHTLRKCQSLVEMQIGPHNVLLPAEELVVMSNTVHFKRPQGIRRGRPHSVKRGKVDGLSVDAARRCKRAFLNTVELNEGVPDWVGLTYPKEWPRDGKIVKNHIHKMAKWAQYKGWCFGWALEYQSRGAPHFHLVLQRGNLDPNSKSPEYKLFRQELAKKWYKVVGSNDPDHLKAGTSSSPIKSPGGATKYLAGYIANNRKPRGGPSASKVTKEKNGNDQKAVPAEVFNSGRMWGLVNCRPKELFRVKGDTPEKAKALTSISRTARRAARSASSSYSVQPRKMSESEATEFLELQRQALRANPQSSKDIEKADSPITPKEVQRARRKWLIVPSWKDKRARYKPKDKGRIRGGFTIYGVGELVKRFCEQSESLAAGQGACLLGTT